MSTATPNHLTTLDKWLLAGLGEALSYPTAQLASRIENLGSMAEQYPAAREAIAHFGREAFVLSFDALAEVYTRTFDIAPSCIPYVSVHLFGEESFHRARLMTGLKASLKAAEIDERGELPDHFALLLRGAPLLDAEEWDDLHDFVMRAAIHAMAETQRQTKNPYRWLLLAVQSVLGPATAADLERLQTSRKDTPKPGQGAGCSGHLASCGGG